MVSNHFLGLEGAENYDRYRPYFHPFVFRRLTQLTGTDHFSRALDIGCGTGQSTQAMADVASTAVGLDASAAMLLQARRRGFPCVCARAEQVPLTADTFDLVSIGLAFHWLDRPAVLRQARRVLRRGGWLLIFNSWFGGTMRQNSSFARWHEAYLQRFPHPPRYETPLEGGAISSARFLDVATERFQHHHALTREALIGYLMTQSNVTSVISAGSTSRDGVQAWLTNTLQPLFNSPTETFSYNGLLSVYQATG